MHGNLKLNNMYILSFDILISNCAKVFDIVRAFEAAAFHCPSSQEIRFTVGQPPLSLHQGEGTTLI